MNKFLPVLILCSISLLVTPAATAAPARGTATASAGARIVAPVRTVAEPLLPSHIEVSSKDQERGYVLLPLSSPSSTLAIRSGDRDEGRLSPPSSTRVRVPVDRTSETVEMVWHSE